MTATHVGGVEVLEAQPVESPLSKADKPMFFTDTLELLLVDGTSAYGCRICDFTSPKMGSVRQHLPNCELRDSVKRAKTRKGVTVVDRRVAAVPPVVVEDAPEDSEGFGDILAALEIALKPRVDPGMEQELTAAREALAATQAKLTASLGQLVTARRDLATAEEEREWWKREYKTVCESMGKIGDMIRKAGFMSP